jgi:hypothetical protein
MPLTIAFVTAWDPISLKLRVAFGELGQERITPPDTGYYYIPSDVPFL